MKEQYYAHYRRVITIGRNLHQVELYKYYTEEEGLSGCVQFIRKFNMKEILSDLKGKLTGDQKKALKEIMSERVDGIVSPLGTYRQY